MVTSARSGRMPVKDLLLHLRLHWQVMLAPLFLWGFVLAAGDNARALITAEFWLVFFVFHVQLLFYLYFYRQSVHVESWPVPYV